MEAKAIAKNIGVSPRKTRIPADIVRGMNANEAINILKYMQKATALPVRKVIESAYANAVNNNKMNGSTLYISEIKIDNGPTQRRIFFKGKGGYRFFKRPSTHITVVLSDVNVHETKPVKQKKESKIEDKKETKKITKAKKPSTKSVKSK